MDINKAEKASELLNSLAKVKNIKICFCTDFYANWELVTKDNYRRLVIPEIIADELKKAVDRSIEQLEKQIEEL